MIKELNILVRTVLSVVLSVLPSYILEASSNNYLLISIIVLICFSFTYQYYVLNYALKNGFDGKNGRKLFLNFSLFVCTLFLAICLYETKIIDTFLVSNSISSSQFNQLWPEYIRWFAGYMLASASFIGTICTKISWKKFI